MSRGKKRMGIALAGLIIIFGVMYFCTKPEDEICESPNTDMPTDTTTVVIEDEIFF